MKDIKVIFRGNKSPSGMNTDTWYMMGEPKIKQLEATGMFDMEFEKPKPKPKPKKKKPSKNKGDE